MKLKKRIAILLTLVFLIFSLVFLKGEFWTNLITENRFESPKNDSKLKSAGFWPNCPRIYISYDNWSETPYDWIQVGLGTKANPHIIENVTINAGEDGSCILIEDSKEYFEIKNCTLYNSRSLTYDAGIFLNGVTNGLLMDNNCSDNNRMGITLMNCNDTKILENEINNNKDIGIYLTYHVNGCNNVTISDNTINYNSNNGIRIWNGNNSKISNNTVDNNFDSGISLVECNYNNLTRNSAFNNTNGIVLDLYSNYNNVSRNTANNNSNSGIYLSNSNFNNVSWNEARYNDFDGIYLLNSNYNTVSHNYLSNNIENALVEDNCNNNFIRDNIYSNVFYSEPFIIDDQGSGGNYTWAQASAQQWWCSGNGTFTNPYVIKNVVINCHNSTYGIVIRNSYVYFRIENCTIYNSNEQSEAAGIKLYNTGNGTLIDNDISNNGYSGIVLSYSNNNSVLDNNVNLNEVGLYLEYNSNNNNITGNIFNSNQQHGIYLYGSSNNTLSSNNFSSCGVFIEWGFMDYLSHTIDISNKVNNKILYYYINETNLGIGNFSNAGQVILVNVNDSIISNLNVSNGSVGISLYYCYNVTVFNNTGSNNNVYGIILHVSENNNITGNTVNFNKDGLRLFGSNNNNISDSIAKYNNENGIHLDACVNITLTGNNMTGNGLYLTVQTGYIEVYSHNIDTTNLVNGKHLYYYINTKNLNSENFTDAGQIVLYNVNNSLISDLNLSRGSYGLSLYNCTNNFISDINSSYNTMYGIIFFGFSNLHTISDNVLNNNGIDGIYLYHSCNQNNITRNTINNNGGNGIKLDSSINNNVYYNNIVGNGVNAMDDGGNNNWDDGYAGNYWDDYLGVDLDQDGIGDSNYSISGNSKANDTRPLMYPIDIDTDGDGLINYEEYTLGIDNYRTNTVNPDTDYDGLSDYWEWHNQTDPTNPDTDLDNMPDGWEVFNGLNATEGTDNLTDSDNDLLLNLYEYLNGTDPQNPDTDYDLVSDYDEILGTLGYITNATNSDTDGDGLLDGYEYGNYTNPLDQDTDNDLIWDYDEIIGTLGYITSPINNDTDGDKLRDDLEYFYNTNPLLSDTDGDNFSDYDEIILYNTSATDISWYPMPNLFVSGFFVSPVYEDHPFILNFTITNNGIWSAEGIIIIIRCEALDLTLYNNTNSPFNLSIGQSRTFLVDCLALTEAGYYVLTLEIDPHNLINEKYSSEDGSLRSDWDDNMEQITMQIIAVGGGDGGFITTMVIIGSTIAGCVIGVVAILFGVKPTVKKRIYSKKQKSKANLELESFEKKLRNFITIKLEENYEYEWWEKGVPENIRIPIESRIQAEKKFISKMKFQYKEFLELNHFYPIISEKNNWDEIFSEVFPNKNNLRENFENLTDFKNTLSQKSATPEEINNYPLFIYGIMNFIAKGFTIFLSYSTKDSAYFQIPEIVTRLESYPKIDKVLYWEVDSGEDIVKYMERALRISKVFVLFCTEKSLKSKAVEDEWEAAFQLRKKGLMKIVPVYEDEKDIPYLLMPLLNVKFSKDDFDGFVKKLYDEILRK